MVFQGEFTIFAGLEDCLRFVENFRFSASGWLSSLHGLDLPMSDIEFVRKILPSDANEGFFEYLRLLSCDRVRIEAVPEGSVVFPKVDTSFAELSAPYPYVFHHVPSPDPSDHRVRPRGNLSAARDDSSQSRQLRESRGDERVEVQTGESLLFRNLLFSSFCPMKKIAGCGSDAAARVWAEKGAGAERRTHGEQVLLHRRFDSLSLSVYRVLLYSHREPFPGFDGTSNLLAGKLYGIPVKGTQAHSFISSFSDEEQLKVRVPSPRGPLLGVPTLQLRTLKTADGSKEVDLLELAKEKLSWLMDAVSCLFSPVNVE